MIKLIGDWKSDAVLLYLTVPLKMRLHSNNILTEHILQYTDSIYFFFHVALIFGFGQYLICIDSEIFMCKMYVKF